ncbi:MAG: hypothetical protein RR589_17260 [Hafnia sp.]|uniref:hypothetical protein n=1 Tax=Hafnia sp. TaxID=1873498 RepID=UPI002FC9EB75
MAIRDPMDLQERSQAFYHSFFNFHASNGSIWFLKDHNHHLVNASAACLGLFSLPNDENSFTFDKLWSPQTLKSHQDYERSVIESGIKITSLEINPRFNNDEFVPYVFTWERFQFESMEYMVFVRAEKFVVRFLDSLIFENAMQIDKKGKSIDLSSIINGFKKQTPYDILTELEWEYAWLIFTNRSYSNIAKIKNKNVSYVSNKASDIFRKMNIPDREVFTLILRYCSWWNHFPKRLFSSDRSILIGPTHGNSDFKSFLRN